MSDPNGSRGLSPWWSLVLLPVALGVGWLAGRSETAPPRPAEVRVEPAAAAPNPEPEPAVRVMRVEVPEPPAPKPSTDEIVSNWTSYSHAVRESERTGKPILLDFNAEWCPPCRRMKWEVFEDRSLFGPIQRAVIPVAIVDRKREEGRNPSETEDLQNRFQVDAFPTLVVFSPRTGRMKKTVGYGGGQYTAWWVTESARSVR